MRDPRSSTGRIARIRRRAAPRSICTRSSAGSRRRDTRSRCSAAAGRAARRARGSTASRSIASARGTPFRSSRARYYQRSTSRGAAPTCSSRTSTRFRCTRRAGARPRDGRARAASLRLDGVPGAGGAARRRGVARRAAARPRVSRACRSRRSARARRTISRRAASRARASRSSIPGIDTVAYTPDAVAALGRAARSPTSAG